MFSEGHIPLIVIPLLQWYMSLREHLDSFPYNCSKGITINGICPFENIWIHPRTTVVKVLLSMVEGHIPLIVIPLLQLYGGECRCSRRDIYH
jgi:hypothetical protein